MYRRVTAATDKACGRVYYRNNGMILHRKSKEQKTVALSSTEAKYVALTLGLTDLTWIKNILTGLRINVVETKIFIDHQSAIQMARSERSALRTKLLDIKECSKNHKVVLQYIQTNSNYQMYLQNS